MYKDVSRRRCLTQWHRGLCRARSLRSAFLALLAFLAPMAQTAHGVDIHYAGAIGQDFLPEPSRAGPAQVPATPPRAQPQPRTELPGLGTRAEEKAAAPMGTWTKVLIGVAVVGAMAALSNKGGGGSGEATVSTDGSSSAGGASAPPASSPPAPAPIVAPPAPPTPTGGGGGRERDDDKGKDKKK